MRTKKRTRRRLVVSVRRVVTQQTIKCFGTKTEKTFSGELGLVKVPCVKKKRQKKVDDSLNKLSKSSAKKILQIKVGFKLNFKS